MGLSLCAEKHEAVAQHALEGLPNKRMVAEFHTALTDEKTLAIEIDCDRKAIDVSNMLLGDIMSSKGVDKELQDNSGEFHDSERIQENCWCGFVDCRSCNERCKEVHLTWPFLNTTS